MDTFNVLVFLFIFFKRKTYSIELGELSRFVFYLETKYISRNTSCWCT